MKALIPAAGLGTRWYPWSKIIPKELLPLGKQPSIHYVLEEAVTSGIREIALIINENKKIIKSYVEEIWHRDHRKVDITWFYQALPLGVADALLSADAWVEDKPVGVLYPDEIHPKEGGLVELCRAYKNSPGCWVGMTPRTDNRRQMPLRIEDDGKEGFRIAGPNSNASYRMTGYGTGRYILPKGFSHMQREISRQGKQSSQELDDDLFFASLWKQEVRGVFLSEPIYDVGSPINWCYAVLHTCKSLVHT